MIQSGETSVARKLRCDELADQLPVFPAGLPQLLSEMSNDKLSLARLSEVLEQFPTIVARLLSVANSAWSSPVREIMALPDACTRLGFNVVRSVSLALAVSSPFDPNRCRHFDPQRFWTSSLLGAELTSQLAEKTGHLSPQQARTAGLLHTLGLIWLAEHLPQETDRALAEAAQQPEQDLNLLIERQCGVGMDIAGGWIAGRLSLPERMVEAIEHHRLAPKGLANHTPLTQLLGLTRMMLAYLAREDELSPIDLPAVPAATQMSVWKNGVRLYPRMRELAATVFA